MVVFNSYVKLPEGKLVAFLGACPIELVGALGVNFPSIGTCCYVKCPVVKLYRCWSKSTSPQCEHAKILRLSSIFRVFLATVTIRIIHGYYALTLLELLHAQGISPWDQRCWGCRHPGYSSIFLCCSYPASFAREISPVSLLVHPRPQYGYNLTIKHPHSWKIVLVNQTISSSYNNQT